MSKLKTIELQNFMSIENARIDFDESNIISLCGYNDSGKSAITRALEVIFYNSYSSDQVKFIKDGHTEFGIGLEFEDGVSINRYKYIDGKSVWEMLKGDKLLFTNRLDNGIAAMGDTPEVIQKYLGVIQDEHTSEQLNVRRNTDRLFLINTTGGDNYKILNSILRSDVLSDASKKLNEDKNKLQSTLSSRGATRDVLVGQLGKLNVMNEQDINTFESDLKNLAVTKTKCEYIASIKEQSDFLDRFKVYAEVSSIDSSKLVDIANIVSCKKEVDKVITPEVDKVDIERLNLIAAINEGYIEASKVVQPSVNSINLERYNDFVRTISLLDVVNEVVQDEVGTVSVDRLNEVKEVGGAFNALWNATNSVNTIQAELDSILAELKRLSVQYNFKVCNNCGTVVQ